MPRQSAGGVMRFTAVVTRSLIAARETGNKERTEGARNFGSLRVTFREGLQPFVLLKDAQKRQNRSPHGRSAAERGGA